MPTKGNLLNLGTPEHQWERHYELRQGDIYVEAGAFWGRYGRIASVKVGSRGRVILIEPSPQNIPVIEGFIKEYKNMMLIKKAVWSRKGRMKFRINGNPCGNRIVLNPSSSSSIVEVETDTVDNLLKELDLTQVDLFTADVEGAEVEMVKGMTESLKQRKILNIAIAAYHRHPDGYYDEIVAMLSGRGYRILEVWGGVVYARCDGRP